MNNDVVKLNDRVIKLETELEFLKNRLRMFDQSATIPIEVDRAFESRGFVKSYSPGIPDPAGDYTITSSTGGTQDDSGFRQDILLTGNAQTIVVPSFPIRFLELTDGSGLYIPLHAYAEFPF